MNESILSTIKRMLGISDEDDVFDFELRMHINSAIMAACQLGVGRKNFEITGYDEVWSDWLDANTGLSAIQQYIYIRVRLAWDPPANSFVVNSFEKQLDEMTWRLNVQAESGVS